MPPRILLVDNYDSFVFNLARYLQELGCETTVVRNDAVSFDEIDQTQPDAIVLSPGPCTPAESGICVELIRRQLRTTPILGVCLGHQAIAVALGGNVIRAPRPVHGQASQLEHSGTGLFDNCPNPLFVGRYHSLIVEESSLHQELTVTSRTDDGILMSFAHHQFPVFGVQFHPESILTDSGHLILANFLRLAGIAVDAQASSSERPQQSQDVDDFYQRQIDADAVLPKSV